MRTAIYALFAFALFTAGMGAIIMTDVGQIFGIEKSWVVWYFKNSVLIMLISTLAIVPALFLARKHKIQGTKWTIVFAAAWLLLILSSKYLTPYFMFRSQQHNAEYISIAEADEEYLEDDDRVLVVDYNGVQRAFPPEYIWMAHIFGGDYGGEDVVFTYCVMTNLASPYINDIDGEEVNFKVLAQTNNNLLLWDTKSNEIIQQITQECEFSNTKLDPIPVLEMTWRGYKKLFPNGTVLYNEWNTPVEAAANLVFDPDEVWHGDSWMFNTANLEDTRLPSKEHIIGIRDDDVGEQLALTKEYIRRNSPVNLEIGTRQIALVHFPEYETIAGFDRASNGTAIEVDTIDIHGNTPRAGKLDRVYIYNSVLWAIWAYYYPNSEVMR